MLLSNLALAFVTGIISSFGHCLGMCGGIVAIYSARQAAQTPADEPQPGLLARIESFLPLHLGRITTYTLFGALIGLVGSLLNQAGGMMGWQGAFSILVGIIMLLVSLSLMGVLPPIEATLVSLTKGNTPMTRMRGLFGKRSFLATLTLGILWGFLPVWIGVRNAGFGGSRRNAVGRCADHACIRLGDGAHPARFWSRCEFAQSQTARGFTILNGSPADALCGSNGFTRAGGCQPHPIIFLRTGDVMVDTIKCDHCGAEANAKYVITKEFDGKTLNFCCRGCLQVYEMMREESLSNPPPVNQGDTGKWHTG